MAFSLLGWQWRGNAEPVEPVIQTPASPITANDCSPVDQDLAEDHCHSKPERVSRPLRKHPSNWPWL